MKNNKKLIASLCVCRYSAIELSSIVLHYERPNEATTTQNPSGQLVNFKALTHKRKKMAN